MNISDLNHLEVVAEETNVEGGYYYGSSAYAGAYANANSIAYGRNPRSYSSTYTNTFVEGTYLAGSSSSATSEASTEEFYY
ncbi:hypothetical protein [Limnoraphis robusta]|jgi:hypothetical protein|uniref:Uncharacterized protein n=1 Tax=Limnoraphis robusta CCNP1315 TaxID=3110306 RepID=A0ABU5TTJ8_9CYAN|nr:hypothetical protein [Limnoraphis robusta]MEA5500278.1 hypothetical protein [Limnoraphis robusta BA-68 BA1]MEA5518227.1 hypothetical protein [Limnoraphis robusta CCNP1315]MEA5544092.1 hypothetical protein [Limnoraphis robusta CCNP1324]